MIISMMNLTVYVESPIYAIYAPSRSHCMWWTYDVTRGIPRDLWCNEESREPLPVSHVAFNAVRSPDEKLFYSRYITSCFTLEVVLLLRSSTWLHYILKSTTSLKMNFMFLFIVILHYALAKPGLPDAWTVPGHDPAGVSSGLFYFKYLFVIVTFIWLNYHVVKTHEV